jgi:hypothetical protein
MLPQEQTRRGGDGSQLDEMGHSSAVLLQQRLRAHPYRGAR